MQGYCNQTELLLFESVFIYYKYEQGYYLAWEVDFKVANEFKN